MINSVKIQGESYLVNGTKNVPKVDGNRDYEEVKVWIKDGGIVELEFTETELLDNSKNDKKVILENDFNKNTALITTALPHEMASWTKQEDQARAWNTDNTVATPFIDELLITRNFGETKQELVNKIIGNADAYEVIYGQLLGQYQNLINQVTSATTLAEAEAITWVENIPPTI